MPGIGDTLREARMRQRLEIADVEERTKIRAKYLRALENEEFGLLPGGTFVRTFLRTYAELLGLDPHPLLDEYRSRHEPGEELEPAPLGPPAAPGGRERDRRGPPGPPRAGMVVLLAVVGVLALLLVLGLTGGDDGEQAARTDTGSAPRVTTEEARPTPAAPRTVTLRIRPSVPTYACVDTGAGTDVVFEGILESSRTFKGRRVRVNLGKTSVALRSNGKAVPLEEGPDPAGFEFTPRRTRELPLGQRPCA